MAEDHTMKLSDGRQLGWATYGDPEGMSVLAMHGSPDSRVVWRLADAAARAGGVSLVAPDRPGFGLSTAKPGRSILDWVSDLDELTDYLGIAKYRVLAISGGSPYALAACWMHPTRIVRLGLLSVISPLNAPGVTRGTSPPIRFTFFSARHLPFLLLPMAKAMARTTLRDPERAARRMLKLRPPADRAIIRRPDVMAVLLDNLPNQFKDPDSIALEMRNAAQPWGFDLNEVAAETTIWQGGLDDVHTPAMARYLTEQLPNAELVFEPDFATFNFVDDMDRIMATLCRPASSP